MCNCITNHRVYFKKLHENARLPEFKTEGAACADVYACKDDIIPKRTTRIIKTGLAMQIPQGCCMIIRGRSGLSVNQNYHVKTGILDADYRGEMGIIISNPDNWDDLHIKAGERIAQIMLTPSMRFEAVEKETLSETERGTGGFGSTGLK